MTLVKYRKQKHFLNSTMSLHRMATLMMIAFASISIVQAFLTPNIIQSQHAPRIKVSNNVIFQQQQPQQPFVLSMTDSQAETEATATTTTTISSNTDSTTVLSIDDVNDKLRQMKEEFDIRMNTTKTVADVEILRREYLGKKGPIGAAMSYMKLLSNDDKPKLGSIVNSIRDTIEVSISERNTILEQEQILYEMERNYIDVTMPGVQDMADIGRRHPISMTMEKAVDIFVQLGYDTVTSCADSPEIETDYYCFTALNSPKDHPARDMQDTFYLTSDMENLLRTHTSSVQIRYLEKNKPPFRIVAPGRVYRKDDIDATHSLMFHQVEILAIEERGQLNIGHLKGTVEHFLKQMLGPDIDVRYRGSYFPFTEPSMEVDVFFNGRWMEVLGCGMVDPNVLEMAGIDSTKYSGFAAGFGVERFAMVIHQIADLRLFTTNDKRFLSQFPFHYDDGLNTFLKGGVINEAKVDIRGTEVFDEIVSSEEELKQLMTSRTTTNSNNNSNDKAATTTTDSTTKEKEKVSKPQVPAAASSSDEIDVSKLDIRVGVITKAWEHEEADKLFCEEIDIGEEIPRTIASGLRKYYTVDQLPGQRVLVLSNLKERKLVGFPSHGMVLCSSSADGTTVQFVEPPMNAIIGERISVPGYDGEPATENQILKKKILEKVFPDLQTNSNGIACYKGVPLSTSAGPCNPSIPNSQVA